MEQPLLALQGVSKSFGGLACIVELDLQAFEGRFPEEMFGRTRFPRIGALPYLLTLAPRGFFWFLLVEGGAGNGNA